MPGHRSAGAGVLESYISPAQTFGMLPSGSVNQTALISLPIEATPSFHSAPRVEQESAILHAGHSYHFDLETDALPVA